MSRLRSAVGALAPLAAEHTFQFYLECAERWRALVRTRPPDDIGRGMFTPT